MRRALSIILIVGLLVIGGGVVAQTAYQVGLDTAITTAVAGVDGAIVTPVVVPPVGYGYGYGFGWHGFGGPGFGFFGFLGFLLFAFLVIGVIRAITLGGRRRGWGGPGGPGGWGSPDGPGHSPWEGRAHQAFEDWHRTAHQDPPRSTDKAE